MVSSAKAASPVISALGIDRGVVVPVELQDRGRPAAAELRVTETTISSVVARRIFMACLIELLAVRLRTGAFMACLSRCGP